MRTKERELARALRRTRGLPIKQIARVVGVAPSSVSVWVRDVPLTAEQLEALRQMNPAYNRQLRGANRNAERGRERRRAYQESGRVAARRGEPLHVAGAVGELPVDLDAGARFGRQLGELALGHGFGP